MDKNNNKKLALAMGIAIFVSPLLAQIQQAGQRFGSDTSDSDFAVMERSGFGLTVPEVESFMSKGKNAWLAEQLKFVGDNCLPEVAQAKIQSLPYENYDPMATAEKFKKAIADAKKNENEVLVNEIKKSRRAPVEQSFERRSIRALYCSHPLQEKAALFWFNHFNVFAPKAAVGVFLPDYEERAIRPRIFGSYYDLVMATLMHPAMMEYLDNAQNAKGKINENYARELMELHTLGVDGGYTQKDVQELARILTGASQDTKAASGLGGKGAEQRWANGFAFYPVRHDSGEKVLLGVKYPSGEGFEEIQKAVRQLTDHPSTAKFISKKLARYFLEDEPSEALVTSMAKAYMDSQGNLGKVMEALVMSSQFAQPKLAKFKEPQDWVYSAIRMQYGQDMVSNYRPLQKWMADLGQNPYYKQTPEGWGARASDWASADQMTKRFGLSKQIVGSAGILFSKKPEEGVEKDEVKRKAAARGLPSDPKALWSLSWRYAGEGLSNALSSASSEGEKRALLIASPEFMKK